MARMGAVAALTATAERRRRQRRLDWLRTFAWTALVVGALVSWVLLAIVLRV